MLKKCHFINFNVNICCMNLELNYYFLGIKPETTEYKISKASYELPKTLNCIKILEK